MAENSSNIFNPDGSINWGAVATAVGQLVGGGLGVAGQVMSAEQQQQYYNLLMALAQVQAQRLQTYYQQQQDAYQQAVQSYGARSEAAQTLWNEMQSTWQQNQQLAQQYNQMQMASYGQRQQSYEAQARAAEQLWNENQQVWSTNQARLATTYAQQQDAYQRAVSQYGEESDIARTLWGEMQATWRENQQLSRQYNQWAAQVFQGRQAIASGLADPSKVAAGTQQFMDPFLTGAQQRLGESVAANLAAKGITPGEGAYAQIVANALAGQYSQAWERAQHGYLQSQQEALQGYSTPPQLAYMQDPRAPRFPQVPSPGTPALGTYAQAPWVPDVPGVPRFQYGEMPGTPWVPGVPMPPAPTSPTSAYGWIQPPGYGGSRAGTGGSMAALGQGIGTGVGAIAQLLSQMLGGGEDPWAGGAPDTPEQAALDQAWMDAISASGGGGLDTSIYDEYYLGGGF